MIPVSLLLLHAPVVGIALGIIAAGVVLATLGTALYGSPELSKRAFRVLHLFWNRPEPPSPPE